MKVPQGRLRKSRVVAEPREPLAEILDRALTGYAVFESQETLLLDAEGRGIVTFESGVPVVAYHTGSDRGGPEALADLAVPGPYHVSLYELPVTDLADIHDATALQVPPGMPAERLAGDPALAQSTRLAAQSALDDVVERTTVESGEGSSEERSAVEAFLDDEEKIDAIRQQARSEARERADEWNL